MNRRALLRGRRVNTIMAVHMAMPKTLVMPSTGTRVVFGA
jgi:hypothetical protein